MTRAQFYSLRSILRHDRRLDRWATANHNPGLLYGYPNSPPKQYLPWRLSILPPGWREIVEPTL